MRLNCKNLPVQVIKKQIEKAGQDKKQPNDEIYEQFFFVFLFSSVSSLHGQNLGDPDEDVERVGVDANAVVDWIVFLDAPRGMVLGSVDDLLGVVEHEPAKQDQTAVECQRVDSCTESSTLEQENRLHQGLVIRCAG